MNATLLETYCGKYNWDDLRKRLAEAEAGSEGVRVGFLGEFSSGKSSLINALLEAPLLPTGDAVTTKRITEISFTDTADRARFFTADGGEISREEFSGSAASPADGHVSMKHPPKGPFATGFSLIDTPGLASLDALDADITCGFLPFLDGAVICVDCAAGSVGQSVIDFLRRPEVAPLAGYFVFALTKADSKSPGARRAVREAVIRELQEEIYTASPASVPARVVLTEVTDAPALADDAAFLKAWKDVFLDRVEGMQSTRREKKRQKVREEMLARLEQMKEAVAASQPEDQSARRRELEEEKRKIEQERKKQQRELDRLTNSLDNAIESLVARYRGLLKNTEAGDLLSLGESFQNDLRNTITSQVASYFKSVESAGDLPPDLQEKLSELATPGFFEEVVNGGIVDMLALFGAVVGGPIGVVIGGAIGVATKLLPKQVINGLVYALTSGSKKKKFDEFLAQIPSTVSARIRLEIEGMFDNEIFGPLEERVQSVRDNLNALWEERERSKRSLQEQEREIDAAIRELKSA